MCGFLPQVARASGLADRHVLVLEVADLADRGVAADVHLAHLARRKTERRPVAFARHELRAGAGRTDHLAALAFLQLDVVNRRAEGDLRQRQRVADQDVGVRAGHDRRADCQAVRREDVALLAVRVVQQGDARRAVRVVLDRRDLRRDAVLVALEVDVAVLLLVTAADEARGDRGRSLLRPPVFGLPLVSAFSGRRLGDLVERVMRLEPDAGDVGLYFLTGIVSSVYRLVE